MPLKMNVLQYSLLSPVDASMDSRGADFSDVDAAGSEAGVVDGIARGRGLPDLGRLALAQVLELEVPPGLGSMFFIYILKGRQKVSNYHN